MRSLFSIMRLCFSSERREIIRIAEEQKRGTDSSLGERAKEKEKE
jgi:hypothetical protein